MTNYEFKDLIMNKNIVEFKFIILDKEGFISSQYVNTIAKKYNLEINYIDNIISDNSFDIFELVNSTLNVFKTKKLDKLDIIPENTIIICEAIDTDLKKRYDDIFCEINSLEKWQVQDFAYSRLEGIDAKYIDWLLDNCGYNIYRVDKEIEKLELFEQNERMIIFKHMVEDNLYADLSDKNIFDFIDAIMKRNLTKLGTIYEDIDYIDVEPLGVVTLLYNNVRKLIQVWLNSNPTPEDTGLSSKQIYAINKLPRVWSQDNLIDIFKFLTNIDYEIKTGNMPMDILRDYVVVKTLVR